MEKRRQKCEVYSRVVGFLSPLSQWNVGKKAEFVDRQTFDQVLQQVQDDTPQVAEKTECCA